MSSVLYAQRKLGDFAPRFSGHTYEDSQKFLTILLNGLHEDLNKAAGLTKELKLMLDETENASNEKVFMHGYLVIC